MEKEQYVNLIQSMQDCLKLSGTGLPGSEDVLSFVSNAVNDADQLIQKAVKEDDGSEVTEGGHQSRAAIAVCDATLMFLATSVVEHHAKGIEANLDGFSSDCFADSLNGFLQRDRAGPVEWDWCLLDEWAEACFRYAPCFDYILGTFEEGDVPQRARKPREPVQRRIANKKQPENVRHEDKEETGVEEVVSKVHKCLTEAYKANDNQPVSFFHFVVDPASFAFTVENMFHLSFLVKDGFVHLDMDSNGLPVVAPVKRKSTAEHGPSNNCQILLTLNMAEWRDVIKVFRVTEPMIVLPRRLMKTSSS